MCAVPVLTPRQREVVSELLAGKTLKEIARDLGIGYYAVRTHLRSTYSKYEVQTARELVLKLAPGDKVPPAEADAAQRNAARQTALAAEELLKTETRRRMSAMLAFSHRLDHALHGDSELRALQQLQRTGYAFLREFDRHGPDAWPLCERSAAHPASEALAEARRWLRRSEALLGPTMSTGSSAKPGRSCGAIRA